MSKGLMESKKPPSRSALRREYKSQTIFIVLVFLISILPFLLALTSSTPRSRGICEFLGHESSFGSYCTVVKQWYTDNVEPVQELRPLVSFPNSWEGQWFDIDKNYGRFEKWFADNLGLRDLMIRGKNELDYRLFSSSSRVYFGKDDDIYGRQLVDRQLPGTENLLRTPENIESIHRGVVAYSDKLKAQGVTVIFVTPMQKQYFYPGRLPFFATHMPQHTNFMTLYDRLKQDQGINFIDVYGILKSNQEKFPLFYRQDFHWTDMSALAIAKNATDRIAQLENKTSPWNYPMDFELRPFTGSDARFSALLLSRETVLEPQLKKTWTWKGVHTVRPLDAKSTGLELESDTLTDPNLLPATCMYGNSFSDGMTRAGIFDFFQRFTTVDRSLTPQEIPELIKGRCKYLIVQILDIGTPTWLTFKQ